MQKYLAQNLQLPWMDGAGGSATVKGPLGSSMANSNRGAFISSAMKLVFFFAGAGLLLMLLAGGFTFLTSAGDTKKLEKGKQQLTNAILGFIIIFAAYWVVQVLGFVFGFDAVKTIFN